MDGRVLGFRGRPYYVAMPSFSFSCMHSCIAWCVYTFQGRSARACGHELALEHVVAMEGQRVVHRRHTYAGYKLITTHARILYMHTELVTCR